MKKTALVSVALLGALFLAVNSNVKRMGNPDMYPPTIVTGTLNPDITQANIKATICNRNWSTKSIRPPVSYTNKLKQIGFDKYKLEGNLSDYELDHYISLELGGNPTDSNNLWMESYNASISDGGARSKDTVEGFLHDRVCDGSMTLQQAQKAITTDWYRIYLDLKGKHVEDIIKPSESDE